MPETRRKYDPQFREGAVCIVRETGKPIAEVARNLGIHAGTLGNWVNKDSLAAESFFSTLEFECLSKRRLPTKAEARRVVAPYIDRCNRIRRHSSCEMKSPVDHEANLAARAAHAARDEEAA